MYQHGPLLLIPFAKHHHIHIKDIINHPVWPSPCGCQTVVIDNFTPMRSIICCQNCVWNNHSRSLTMSHGYSLCLRQLSKNKWITFSAVVCFEHDTKTDQLLNRHTLINIALFPATFGMPVIKSIEMELIFCLSIGKCLSFSISGWVECLVIWHLT